MSRRDAAPLVVGFALILVVTSIAAFGLGFLFGELTDTGDVGNSPAIDIAREYGWAMPIDQHAAFADGVITRDEVEQAVDRLTVCVESHGVIGFFAELQENGTDFSSEWQTSEGNAVELCRRQQFDATYNVWLNQELRQP